MLDGELRAMSRHPDSAEWPAGYGKPFNHASGFLNVSVERQAPKNEIAAATMIR